MRPTTRTIRVLIGVFLQAWLAGVVSEARAGDDLRYDRDVRPLLAEACFRCHGPGEAKAGLRLDVRDATLVPTSSGAVPIVPGAPDESELIRRILAEDEGEVMPPPKAKKPLTNEQKTVLRRWVEQGAPYEKHWAFRPPVKGKVPPMEGPGSAKNPIDAFIADRLRREGLSPAPEADKATLIRRVALALTGLPPTPVEVDAYLGDPSARAYEDMVDRYLASPRHGEEMARHWLDVARYADTHGLHLDNERQMWPYRDWVVRAFNANVPFNRFTVEQLAGDLLPEPTREQLLATGFNRCNVTTSEGGSIESEWTFRNAVDRTSTMAEAWMGLTAGCAVCHDHKFDPISTKEFYSLYAFFYSAAGPALDGNKLIHEPFLKLSTPEQEAQLAALDGQIAEVRGEVEKQYRAIAYRDPAESTIGEGDSSSPDAQDAATDDAGAADPTRSFLAWLKKGVAKEAPPEVAAKLKQFKNDKLTPEGRAEVRAYYVQQVCVDTKGPFEPLIGRLNGLSKARESLDATIPGSFIFKEMDRPRDAFVMSRGQYDKPGEAVEPGTPSVLPALETSGPGRRATRLDLANWLVAPEHPLTARVAVNRLWQQLFGTGLVKTSYDFGTQGEPPSHPELLDWLAVSFREGGWDVKALVRLMVTSSTFRRSSRVEPEILTRDPENRLYARGPRLRLDAEQIRDSTLR